ncbi:hypothetical protein [Myxococcus sp. CA039A]|uniref:hypothetical protein n=1 Tax=Myxococcus sp. CA039A TaxID=2741737 RepID=UPI00157AC4BA|nr:hypothetical protein [Myxococcus sp. CA039A]NTX56918.1 hypothetical protein [Myxococcus sp. CA039A]
MQAHQDSTPTPPPPSKGDAAPQESTSTAKAEATPVVWPRDLNLPTSGELTWGFDPEGLQDG